MGNCWIKLIWYCFEYDSGGVVCGMWMVLFYGV